MIQTLIRKNPQLSLRVSTVFKAWQFPTLTWGDPTLPSALRRFTAEFGMGSGGTAALSPPGIFGFIPAVVAPCCHNRPNQSLNKLKISSLCRLLTAIHCLPAPKHLRCCKVKPLGSLVLVSSMHRCTYTPSLSTSSSQTFLP